MHYTTCTLDPCNTKFLMKFKDTMIGTIIKFINTSLNTGKFLDEWKIAVVRCLIKGQNLDTDYKNYCPISNLSFMSKLTEKAAQTQLMAHFTEQNLLPKHQNGYRKNFQHRLPYLISLTISGPTWKTKILPLLYSLTSVQHLTL